MCQNLIGYATCAMIFSVGYVTDMQASLLALLYSSHLLKLFFKAQKLLK